MNDHGIISKIEDAMQELSRAGYLVRSKFGCCPGHAREALEEEGESTDKIVLFHPNDLEELETRGSMHLTWSGDPEEIMKALRARGLAVEWRGTKDHRIKVTWMQ